MACIVEQKEDGSLVYRLDPADVERYIARAPAAAHLIGMMKDYVENRRYPGDALGGMLENDLRKFFCHADETTLRHATTLFKFVYNVMPERCWGSDEMVRAFLDGTELC